MRGGQRTQGRCTELAQQRKKRILLVERVIMEIHL